MASRATWMCAECGEEWSLVEMCCHSDQCEVGRRFTEDEEAIPRPAVGPQPSDGQVKEK